MASATAETRSPPEYQTIAGFLLHALNSVPQPGCSVSRNGVVDMDGPRIAKVKAERRDP